MTESPNFGKPHESQRGFFAASLFEQMVANKDIWLVVADLGFGVFDKHFRDFPERCINTGAAEQAGMGLAVGLALENKQVFTYTITSFYLRAAETIGLYLHGEQIPVKLVGSGRDADYAHDGPSHHAGIAQAYLGSLHIMNLYPDTKEEIPDTVDRMIKSGKPSFISLKR